MLSVKSLTHTESSNTVIYDDKASFSSSPIAKDKMDENGFISAEASELKRHRIDLESGRYESHELIEV